jgi:Heparinase II/III-like protein/Heparinase II/III N-terminus
MSVLEAENVADRLRSLGLRREQRRLQLPQVQVVGPWRAREPTRKAMLAGLFYVYGKEARLVPPLDWRQDPHGSRTWRYELHTLTWLKAALARHAAGRDVEMLAVARDLVLDWARHLRPEEEQSEFAWYDMAVGLRAPYVAYVLRACLAEEMLEERDAELLVDLAERHGECLAAGGDYASGHNHGLFQDEGLYLLARLLPALPAAPAWGELALARMGSTLRETVSFAEGAHLEHSPAYQLALIDLVARMAANAPEMAELRDLLGRLRRTAAWQVTPSGRLAQLGDTDDTQAPQWARETAAQLRGLNPMFEAGQAFVREGSSYLAVGAAYHGPAHKQADDGGLLLVEGGVTVLGDAGRWGYYESEPDRLYARSARAHNVLTVDGKDFGWRGTEPYGSGLESAGEGAGSYAIAAANPLLRHQGVEHRRQLLYSPGERLIVVDEVSSAEEHEYERHFHFGPELEARRVGERGIALEGGGLAIAFTDVGAGAEIELARGVEAPGRLGWTYPGDRERAPVWTATLRARATEARFAVVLGIGRGEPDGPAAQGRLSPDRRSA